MSASAMHEKPEKIFPVYITASSPRVAARRERAMKRWRRDWKIALIENHNPTWRDLFADVLRDNGLAWWAPLSLARGQDPG